MQRTLQPYSFLPTDVRNTNHRFMDISGASTLDPTAQVPMDAQTTGAVPNEVDPTTGQVINKNMLNNTPNYPLT